MGAKIFKVNPSAWVQAENKIKRENYLLLALIIFLSARANIIALHYSMLIIVFCYTTWLFIKRGREFQFSIMLLAGVYLLSLLVYYLSFGWVDVLRSLRMLLIFGMAYMAVRILGKNFLIGYERIVYYLAIVSIILFPLQLLAYNEMFKVVDLFSNIIPNFGGRLNLSFSNIIIFSINGDGALRNSGFAWEPKGFGNFLIIAIVINLVQNRFRINKRLVVFVLAVLTTFSTVAYLILFFLIPFFILLNTNKSYIFFFLPFVIVALILSIQLPFMQKKIELEWKNRYAYKELLNDSRFVNMERSLGRLPSLMLDVNDFLKRPVFGYGFQKKERTQSVYVDLVRVNGLSDWLAVFGTVGFLYLLLAHYYGFRKYLRHYNMKGQTILVAIILCIYFATNLMTFPFWTMLMFLFIPDYEPAGELNEAHITCHVANI